MKKVIFVPLGVALLLSIIGTTTGTVHADAINEIQSKSAHSHEINYKFGDLGVDLGTHHTTSIDNLISGKTTRPNCDIIVYFSSATYIGKSDNDGNFKISINNYSAGTEFFVEAIDPNTLDTAIVKSIVYPRIPALFGLNAGETTVEGEADPGAEISLQLTRGNTTYKFSTLADTQGNFFISLKDYKNNPLFLTNGDILTYYETLTELGLDSDTGTITIYAY